MQRRGIQEGTTGPAIYEEWSLHHQNKVDAYDERYFHMQRAALNLTLPWPAHCGASPPRIRISGAMPRPLRITAAYQAPRMFHFLPSQPAVHLLPCRHSSWLPLIRCRSRPGHSSWASGSPASSCSNVHRSRPLKNREASTCKSMRLQRVGSTTVAQPNLTELPRKG